MALFAFTKVLLDSYERLPRSSTSQLQNQSCLGYSATGIRNQTSGELKCRGVASSGDLVVIELTTAATSTVLDRFFHQTSERGHNHAERQNTFH
jgi:hypothetical protein